MAKVIGIFVLSLLSVLALFYALTWIGLIGNRPIQQYQEQTRKVVYDTSRQYQQGTNRDIARYCEQMRTAENQPAKKAVAALIRSTADTYDGPLSSDNASCLNDAKGI